MDNYLLPLLPKEFEILLLFVKNPKRIFTKEEIFFFIWKENICDSDLNTVAVHISNLRKKLRLPNKDKSLDVINYKGFGYKISD